MKSRLLLLPACAMTITVPLHAEVYMSLEQAKALMFPDATLTADFRTLSDSDVAAIEKASNVDVRSREVHAWRASTGGWLIADEVLGKHEFIPFVLALDESGAVKRIEILEYRESYGSEICEPKWRAQFIGKNATSSVKLGNGIQYISGATLSSRHVTDGVRRLLATYALILTRRDAKL